jgi:hypothetical protein
MDRKANFLVGAPLCGQSTVGKARYLGAEGQGILKRQFDLIVQRPALKVRDLGQSNVALPVAMVWMIARIAAIAIPSSSGPALLTHFVFLLGQQPLNVLGAILLVVLHCTF